MPEGVFGGPVDRVVLAVEVLDREAAGDPLLVTRLSGGCRVRLAGPVAGLGADDELGAGHGQQVAQLGRVEEIGGGQDAFLCGPSVADHHGADPIALDLRADRFVLEQAEQPAAGGIGSQHGRQYGQRHGWLVAELRDASVAGVQGSGRSRLGGHRIMAAVIVPDSLSERPIGGIGAELLDPGMFVGGHGLRGELSADPIGRLGQDDGAADAQRRQGRGAAAQTATDDREIRGDFSPARGAELLSPPLRRGQETRQAGPASFEKPLNGASSSRTSWQ